MAAFRLLLTCCVLLVFSLSLASLPEPGKLQMEFSMYDTYLGFPKALYKGATISVKGTCSSVEDHKPTIKILWKLKYTQCADLFAGVKENVLSYFWKNYRRYEITGEDTVTCDGKFIQMTDESEQEEYNPPDNDILNTTASESNKGVDEENNTNKKREQKSKPQDQEKGADATKGTKKKGKKQDGKETNSPSQSKAKKGGQTSEDDGKSNKKQHPVKLKHPAAAKANERKERSAELKDMLKTLVRVKRDEMKKDESNSVPETKTKPKKKKHKNVQSNKAPKKEDADVNGGNKPDADSSDAKKGVMSDPKKPKISPKGTKKSSVIAKAKRDGIYLLIMTVQPAEPSELEKDDPKFKLDLDVAMESKSGYLSATDWPLLPFYGIMSLVYLFYGIIWLIVSACQWRDLLRIQFWIGGVIALGMLEKAVFYSEYNNINNTGFTTPSLVVFAEIVSVAKRTLARMLVIIVSMGFGIVKPRLGKSLHRVMGVGALYFIIGIVEGCLRALSLKADPSKEQLIAGIPLAVLDAAICWWIFMSLVQTTRTLRIRRNVIKLSLYRHFTNTLIFAVLASVAYMIWSIKTHKFADCMKDWSELWLDDAFWHFLFSIILLVIMILWRPTANNQRYAFTPIVDFDDDEEDNVTLSEAFEGMKMRNTRTEVIVNGDSKKKAEDDLKWVEENIPSSAADTVLPSVLDSDEELMTTKFEMSKME